MGSIVPFLLRSLDSDAARMCNEGGIGGAGERRAVSNLAKGLKRAGLWSSMYALYPFAGGSSQAHAQNLVSASYPITWVNSPTHDSNGVTFNGTTNYGQCVGLTGNTIVPHLCGMTVYARTNGGSSIRRMCGFGDAGGLAYYALDFSTFGSTFNRGCLGLAAGYVNDTSGTAARTGVLSINRTSTSSMKSYDDGVEYLSYTTSDTNTPAAFDCYVGAFNAGGSPLSHWGNNMALFSVHAGLTAEQAATFATLIAEYQTALGRNV